MTLLKIALVVILFSSLTVIAGESVQQGRYQIVINPSVRADTFLLDTWTGKVWQQTQFTDMDEEPTVWQLMDKIDGKKDYDGWRKSHFSKKEVAEYEKSIAAKPRETFIDVTEMPTPKNTGDSSKFKK